MSRRKQKRPQQLVNADPGGTRLMPQGEEIIPLLIICYPGLTDSDALFLFFLNDWLIKVFHKWLCSRA